MADHSKVLSPGSEVADLEAAWQDRLEDAKVLRRSRRYAMSMVFGYYAQEILLKVRICRHLDPTRLPRAFEFHDLEALLILSGLREDLSRSSAVKTHWDEIKKLVGKVDELRYGPGARRTKKDADLLHHRLWEDPNGVIPWLQKRL